MKVKEMMKKIQSITPKDGDLGMEEQIRLMQAYDRHCREMFPIALEALEVAESLLTILEDTVKGADDSITLVRGELEKLIKKMKEVKDVD